MPTTRSLTELHRTLLGLQVEPGCNVRGCATDIIGVSDPIAVLLDPHRLGEPLRTQVGPDVGALFCRWRDSGCVSGRPITAHLESANSSYSVPVTFSLSAAYQRCVDAVVYEASACGVNRARTTLKGESETYCLNNRVCTIASEHALCATGLGQVASCPLVRFHR